MPDPNPQMKDGMIAMFELRFRDLAQELTDGKMDLGSWQLEMRTELRNLYAMQIIAASGVENRADVNPDDWLRLGSVLKGQYEYLADFAEEIQGGNLSAAMIASRSAKYASTSKVAFWGQANKDYNVPAQPGEGTVCKCGCYWRFVVNEDGSVDAYWEKPLEDSCDICIWRYENWYPYHIEAEAVAA